MKNYNITVNGVMYEVEVEEVSSSSAIQKPATTSAPVAAPVKKASTPKPKAAPAPGPVAEGETTVTAPMPGTILSVEVSEGASINAGDVLVILEAMKMENEIKAAVGGTVKQVVTSKGANVNPGDVLVVIA